MLLTDQRGLYTADPRRDPTAQFVSVGRADDVQYEAMAGGTGTGISRGGMLTKILAARRASNTGIHTVIASGHEQNVLQRVLSGEAIGTLLYAPEASLAKRKSWLADLLQMRGRVTLDAGASKALLHGGKSRGGESQSRVDCGGDEIQDRKQIGARESGQGIFVWRRENCDQSRHERGIEWQSRERRPGLCLHRLGH